MQKLKPWIVVLPHQLGVNIMYMLSNDSLAGGVLFSDDDGSLITFEALAEAVNFAKKRLETVFFFFAHC